MVAVDFGAITAYQRYKLMASLVVPRPIALVTTQSLEGIVNAAPFSMFNMLGEDPPILAVSINYLDGGAQKDTARNIDAQREFVIHLADEAIAEKMHRCGDRFPSSVSELDAVGFTAATSHRVRPPRIAEAPVAFECRLWQTIQIASRQIFIGEALVLHAREELLDLDRYRVRLRSYFPVGRFGASFYVSTRDRFAMRPAEAEGHGSDIDEL